jgi:hypothetical protein
MRNSVVLAAVIFLLCPAAFADSFLFSLSSTTETTMVSPDDNFWGTYSTASPGPVTVDFTYGTATVPGFSFSLAPGSTITSATVFLLLPTTETPGTSTGFVAPEAPFPPPDPSEPSTAPTFGSGTFSVAGTDFGTIGVAGSSCIGFGSGGTFDLCNIATIGGDEVSSGILDLTMLLPSEVETHVSATSPGSNWAGYVDATGTVDLPYTIEVEGTYTPAVTPEPSSIFLLGTAMLAGVGLVSRRRWACGVSAASV